MKSNYLVFVAFLQYYMFNSTRCRHRGQIDDLDSQGLWDINQFSIVVRRVVGPVIILDLYGRDLSGSVGADQHNVAFQGVERIK